MSDQNKLESQLKEWQDKLDFFKEQEAKIVDLEQKFNANKKIKEAEQKVEELEKKIQQNENNEEELKPLINLKDSSDIKTLHQALDIFIEQKDKLDHKTTQEEFEELEKIGNEFFEKIFGDYKDKINAIPVLKDKSIISLFERILTSEKLKGSIIDEIANLRKDGNTYEHYDRSVIVSALTLSVLSWKTFDYKKIDFLIDFLTGFENKVWQKALTGIILSIIIHQNRLQRFPQLVRRLQTLQEIEKVQIGIFVIDVILRNQLYEYVCFPAQIEDIHFLNETPYNWFFPFYKDNKVLKEALDKTEQDIDMVNFTNVIYSIPFIDALKYVLCDKLGENKIKVPKTIDEEQKENAIVEILNMSLQFAPYYNLISEIYLYYRHYPKERVVKLFNSKITLAETKLKNIILSKTQALKLAANLHFEKEEYSSCIQKLKELLNIEPNQLSALKQISQCYIEKGEFSTALTYLLQIEGVRNNDVNNLYKIAICLNSTEQYKKSNEYLTKLDELKPNNESVLDLTGNNYFKLGDYKTSILYNKRVISLNDKNEMAILELSSCYSKLNKHKEAIKYTKQLYEIDHRNTAYMISLAMDYVELGNYDRSLELAHEAFMLDSDNPDIIFDYGRILFCAKDFTKSKIMLNRVVNHKKGRGFRGVAYGNLGHIYLFENNAEKSNLFYRKCVLEFDDVKEFEEKFDIDWQYAQEQNISKDQYEKIKQDLISYWQQNK